MSRTSVLTTPVAKHLSSAVVTGLVVYLRPGRVPKAIRRGLLATNTAGSATAMLVGSSKPAVGAAAQPAPLADRVGAGADSIGDVGTALASVAGSVTLLTSKPALKLDGKVEQLLLRRGSARPRLLMAVGAAGLVVVLGVVTDRVAKAAERKVAELQQEEELGQLKTGVNPPVANR